jgi:hypothetical protein
MEENLRGNVPLPDQKKKNSELTRSNSDSSGLTLDDANARPVISLSRNLFVSLAMNLRIIWKACVFILDLQSFCKICEFFPFLLVVFEYLFLIFAIVALLKTSQNLRQKRGNKK